MSNEALTWAFRQTAPSTGAKFVLVALADGANQEHRCIPGQAKLMAMTGQGARSIVRHLGELEAAGLVIRERRNAGYQKRLPDGFRLPVGVVVSVPSLPQDATVAGVTVAPSESQDANLAHVMVAPGGTTRHGDTGQIGRIKEPKEITTTTTSRTSDIVPIRADVERICEYLAAAIEANGSKRPRISERWRMQARLLLDADERTEEQVMRAIDWSQQSEFWRANILSMPKLREKYDQMRLQAAQRGGRQNETDQLFERAAKRMGVV